MDKERKLLMIAFKAYEIPLKNSTMDNALENPKSAEASTKVRKEGNALLLQQNKHNITTHEKIFDLYCQSIALAPIDSQELALAYGNRSYFLLHNIGKYEDCIKDIDRALKISTSDVLQAKLLCRKAECFKRLGSSDFLSILESAQKFIDKIDGQDKVKLLQMVNAVNDLIVNDKVSNEQKEKMNPIPVTVSVTDDYLNCVSIQYNKKYGRHLVAAKDYKPGDIILVDKIYAFANIDRLNSYCHNCSKAVWSSVPCQHCSWTMFCSESCREKAWNKFHDLECTLISYLKTIVPEDCWKSFVLPIRTWITGIKEAGSIANLKEILERVDNCKDLSTKGFFENGKLITNSIRNVYSLPSDIDNPSFCADVPCLIPSILYYFIKYSKLNDEYCVKTLEDLATNHDIIFLGSLLIRIYAVTIVCGNDCTSGMRDSLDPDASGVCVKKKILTTISNLVNHSCFSSAMWCCTEDNTLVLLATQPIKEGSQIFMSYISEFYEVPKKERFDHMAKHDFVCDCQACIESWQPILSLADQNPLYLMLSDFSDENKKFILMECHENIDKAFSEGQLNEIQIAKLSTSISQAATWTQPSFCYCSLLDLLKSSLMFLYAQKPPVFHRSG